MMRTVVAACLLGAVAAADAGDDFESRVAQVIFNTSKMERLTEAPDTDTIERWRHEKDNGEVIYSYRTPREVEDHGVPILWQFQIRVLPPDWKPDPAGEKKWAEKVVGTDSKTEAECAFLVSKGGEVRRTKVYFRIVKGSVKLVMAVTRPGPEEAKGAIEKALERWHFFYEEAKRYGLFEDARFLILPACPVGPRGPIFDDPVGDREGGLDKAEALSFLFNHTETVTFPLKVQVEAPEIDDDKPYRFKVSMKHGLGRPGVELVDGRGASLGAPDAGGFVEVEVARGNQPASLGVRFAAFDLTPGQDLAGRVTDQIAQRRRRRGDHPRPARRRPAAGRLVARTHPALDPARGRHGLPRLPEGAGERRREARQVGVGHRGDPGRPGVGLQLLSHSRRRPCLRLAPAREAGGLSERQGLRRQRDGSDELAGASEQAGRLHHGCQPQPVPPDPGLPPGRPALVRHGSAYHRTRQAHRRRFRSRSGR
ncbi:MAG: hypothetical protein ACYSUM_19970 [Planctomycetota bacterium]|jgi:hypothetical protein